MSTQGRMKSMNYTVVKNWMRKLCGKKPNDIIHWFGEKPWYTQMRETEWVEFDEGNQMSKR